MKSRESNSRRAFLKGAAATPLLIAGSVALAAKEAQPSASMVGPSTVTEPYLRPTIAGVKLVSILSVGDSVGGYRMVGIPDGLGAFASGRGEFTLLMNHEITANPAGIVRAHGATGAFVSRWTIDSQTLMVKRGQDHSPSASKVFVWDAAAGRHVPYVATVPPSVLWQRHCSADLPAPGAFFHRGRGTNERIFMNGEEVADGRAWARIATGAHVGEAWQLPRFGRMAYENAVASPYAQDKTIVALTDDSSAATGPLPNNGSEVYFYIGAKQSSGHPIEQAGLTNGLLYGVSISVDGAHVNGEDNVFGLGNSTTGYVAAGRFELVSLGDVSGINSGLALESLSNASNVTRLQRCEDGAWDPRQGHENYFYFVTTASITTNCRLWRLRFDDIERPEAGGSVEIMLRGDEGHRMLDNVTIDGLGRILMDEDPGGDNRVAKIWLYSIDTRELIQVAAHTPKFFDADSKKPDFITIDEESSGIVDAAHILGEGWFLVDVQSHKANSDPELVEGGQLLALWVDPDIGFNGDAKRQRHDHNEERR